MLTDYNNVNVDNELSQILELKEVNLNNDLSIHLSTKLLAFNLWAPSPSRLKMVPTDVVVIKEVVQEVPAVIKEVVREVPVERVVVKEVVKEVVVVQTVSVPVEVCCISTRTDAHEQTETYTRKLASLKSQRKREDEEKEKEAEDERPTIFSFSFCIGDCDQGVGGCQGAHQGGSR